MSASPHSEQLPISPRVLTVLRLLLAALSALMVVLFVYTALRRMHFAFEYDWIEDGMLASVRHIRSGLPLYSAPSTTFTPYLYTPVYLYIAAAISRGMGISYATLRLLSMLSTLGCFAVIYLLVWHEARKHLAAIAAVGLFAACYPVFQGAFDLGRVDMLYLFFVLLAFYVTRFGNPALAALLWVLAFQTKQGVLPIALLALCYDWQRPRRVLLGLGSFVALLGASIFLLNVLSHGWYNYYVFHLAGGFGLVKAQATDFLRADLVRPCGIALLVVFAAWLAAPPSLRSRALSFYTLGSLGMVAFTGYLRAHRGANFNSLLPMYAWLAVLFGLALARLFSALEHFPCGCNPGRMVPWAFSSMKTPLHGSPGIPINRENVLERRNSRAADAALTLLLTVASLQLAQHLYSPASLLPSAQQLAEREAFEHQLRLIPGEVMVLSHPEDAVLAAKPLFAGSESIGAVIDAPDHTRGDALAQLYQQLLHSGELSAVVLDMSAEQNLAQQSDGHRIWMPADFLALYPLRVAAAGADQQALGSEPRWIYLPCNSLGVAKALDADVDAGACSSIQSGRISSSAGSR